MSHDYIHQNRRLSQSNVSWIQQFACEDIDCLIICRGPIRKEVMDVFTEMGAKYSILLSEKDSIIYQNALAPELRLISDPTHIHRVPDYTGASKEERDQRIQQIIQIAKDNGHNSIFAGYGFMSEDESLVRAIEESGLTFIGPCSRTVRQAGLKDEAKRTALAADVSVVPGVDDLTVRTLLAKGSREGGLDVIAKAHQLEIPDRPSDADQAEALLAASYQALVDVISIDEIAAQAEIEVAKLFDQQPNNRIRLKAIGGGGGKGQRILVAPKDYSGDHHTQVKDAASKVPALLREVLNEVKATGRGDNKNVLIELNIETTRHQEIQVIGNGEWCMTLGGRDCSLQMHEQKLLEVSVTRESLIDSATQARTMGADITADALDRDVATLDAMEDEAARFGEAVGLDSVSTFECIVDTDSHFFMEMNTRIQVEHRVSELCYALEFSNPDNSAESFVVYSLVEAMVLLAAHRSKLPKPQRRARFNDSLEARLNATNDALQPHAGGQIEYWSDAVEGEIRDDQGICVHNPDTDVFMKYTLAGAYDSNIALLLTVGESRHTTYERMAELLRVTTLRGRDLSTNLNFHYGLVHWFLGRTVDARPTTKFIVPYLTAVGELAQLSNTVDLDVAWHRLAARHSGIAAQVLEAKRTLLTRPISALLECPHQLSGWLSANQSAFSSDGSGIRFAENPIGLLADTYHYLNLSADRQGAAAERIWSLDAKTLEQAEGFYSDLSKASNLDDWSALEQLLASDEVPNCIAEEQWPAIRAAHAGHQLGLELLFLLAAMAKSTGFYDLAVNDDLSIHIPERLLDESHQDAMAKALAPPPVAKSDEIVATSGGMFYGREAPESPLYVEAGSTFAVGDPLFIVEVMKMFNKVNAPFAGRIDEVLVEGDGVIIKKGQAIFKVTPDDKLEDISPEEVAQRRAKATDALLAAID